MNKKTLAKFILTMLLIISLSAVFINASCTNSNQELGESPTGPTEVSIIFADENLNLITACKVTCDGDYLIDAVQALGAEGNVSFDTVDSIYGITVNSFTINDTTYGNWNAGEYVMIFTSLQDIEYISVYDGSIIKVNDESYNACGLSAGKMPLVNGATYVFTVMTF